MMIAIVAPGIALASCATGTPRSASPTTANTSASTRPRPVGLASQANMQRSLAAGNPSGHAYVPAIARAVTTNRPNHVIGSGTASSCTSAAVVRAVAEGGIITFSCGPKPVTIKMTATAKVVNTSRQVVLDGGGMVTLSGSGNHQILYLDTCDSRQILTTNDCIDQEWPQLVVQNLNFEDGYSAVRETQGTPYGGGGGGAIYAEGGQLKVLNSLFVDNRCYQLGPDLGGGAIRAIAQWGERPVFIIKDTFRDDACSNGGALSSIDSNWALINSVMIGNKAVGWGANPASTGTPGGGSGGAIYTDGNNYYVLMAGTVVRGNTAREGGGGVFFVVDNKKGTLTIKDSTLHNNPSGEFFTAGYPGVFFHSSGKPLVIASVVN
jgi:hypothetical protein